MTNHLSLVLGESRSAPAFDPLPVALSERTQRPGELADLVAIQLSAELRVHVEALASRARMPLHLWAVIAVEAERALAEVAGAGSAAELAAAFDAAAGTAPTSEFSPMPARALRAYAAALRASAWRRSPRQKPELNLVVVDRLRARWSLEAQAAGLTLPTWIAARLASAEVGREHWEAQAAFEGRTLAEWAALQALKRNRLAST
jgi:hypothetical protein